MGTISVVIGAVVISAFLAFGVYYLVTRTRFEDDAYNKSIEDIDEDKTI